MIAYAACGDRLYDGSGTVEFVAHYWDPVRREYGRQHEDSSFVREGGRWFYLAMRDSLGHTALVG